MKRSSFFLILHCALLVAGCSTQVGTKSPATAEMRNKDAAEVAHAKSKPEERITIQDAGGPVVVQKIAFRHGVSSATVESLARRFGCAGGSGAGLLTGKGPVEVYRMQCDNGTTFFARCELRQCRPMR